jgi:predicted PurR-regulated permease PerM
MAAQASSMVTHAGVFFSGILGALASVVIVAFVGIYLAVRPASYINGLVRLFPADKRPRTREIMHEIGHVLAQWLLGKMISMVIIGCLTALGLALLDVPLAMVLGILAGLLDFIPYIGPIMAGLPAVLIAFSESPTLALYVLLLFVGLQTTEAYLLSPLIERRTVSLPPAITIMMQTLLGTFFGLAGIALATPLTAVLAVLVTMLYVQDVLGDPVKIPGEH